MAKLFEECPKSKRSMSGKLWRWFTEQTGEEPTRLWSVQPGKRQREAGAVRFVIESNGKEYMVDDVNSAVRHVFNPKPTRLTISGYYLTEFDMNAHWVIEDRTYVYDMGDYKVTVSQHNNGLWKIAETNYKDDVFISYDELDVCLIFVEQHYLLSKQGE